MIMAYKSLYVHDIGIIFVQFLCQHFIFSFSVVDHDLDLLVLVPKWHQKLAFQVGIVTLVANLYELVRVFWVFSIPLDHGLVDSPATERTWVKPEYQFDNPSFLPVM